MAHRLVECIAQWHCGPIRSLAHAPSAAGWAATDGRMLHLYCDDVHAMSVPVPGGGAGALRFDRDGARVLIARQGFDLAERRWQAPDWLASPATDDHRKSPPLVAAWSADGGLLVEVDHGPSVQLIATSAAAPGGVMLLAGERAAAVRSIAIGRRHVVAGDAALSVWARDGHDHVADLAAHDLAVLDLAFAHDDALFASVGADGCLAIWDAAGWTRLAMRQVTAGALAALAVHPREPIIATGGTDGILRLHGLDAAPLHEEPFDAPLTALAYAPSGDRLIVALGGAEPRLLWLRLL
ncbi:MAG: hypothetical protein JSR59_14695 [Proteobacteria bacterium]|nr:hypothetical protein [Pseudomonadota bacterium]